MFRNWPRERQIEFPPLQTHSRLLAPVLLLASLACIVIVVIILLVHPSGPFIGPWG
jgi:hypothetical protein